MKNKILLCSFIYLLSFFYHNSTFGQNVGFIKGSVVNNQLNPLVGANIVITDLFIGTITDEEGKFEIANLAPGAYTLVVSISFIGYETERRVVSLRPGEETVLNVVLEENALQMNQFIVTGTFDERTKLESSVSITTLNSKGIDERASRGTGDLLSTIPGTFVDMSAGEVGNIVYARGLASGAKSLPGFYYVSLQEEGLPITSTQYIFTFNDLFHRTDATVNRLEAIRGGSSAISAPNAPGGIFNFISKKGGEKFGGDVTLKGGLHTNGNPLFRADVNFGGPIGKKDWRYNIGGFYRSDEGARNIPFKANEGGQLKFNLTKTTKQRSIKLYGKALVDQNTRFLNVPIGIEAGGTALNDADVFSEFNLNTDALFLDVASDSLFDNEQVREEPTARRNFDTKKGLASKNFALGAEITQQLGKGWKLHNNIRYANLQQRGQQFREELILPANVGVAAFFRIPTSSSFYNDNFTFRDAQTNEVLYNSALGIDKLNNRFLITGGVDAKASIQDIVNQFEIKKSFTKHQFTTGLYTSHAKVDNNLVSHILIGSFEPNPRALYVTHPNPMATPAFPTEPTTMEFSDKNGVIGHGGAAYRVADMKATNIAGFVNDVWEINDKVNLDAGLRYEWFNHQGSKEIFDTPTNPQTGMGATTFVHPVSGDTLATFSNGQDGNYATWYDLSLRRGTGEFHDFDFYYNYLSGSVGLNYQLDKTMALYGRLSRGNKVPELSFYHANFDNAPIEKGNIEKIWQGEVGYKLNRTKYSLGLNGFYSRMNDVAYFVFIAGGGGVNIQTPPTFNSINTVGTEIEAFINPIKNFDVKVIATLQNPTFISFDYYNSNGTAVPVFIGDEGSDDFIEKFDGNTVPDVPKVLVDVTPAYQLKNWKFWVNWRYVGERQANRRNTVTLPAFHQFDIGLSAELTQHFQVMFNMNNAFNSAGLMNFNGVGAFGSTRDDLARGGVINPNTGEAIPNTDLDAYEKVGQPFFARPILPRFASLGLRYNF